MHTYYKCKDFWFPLEFKLVQFLCLSNHRAGNFHGEFPSLTGELFGTRKISELEMCVDMSFGGGETNIFVGSSPGGPPKKSGQNTVV